MANESIPQLGTAPPPVIFSAGQGTITDFGGGKKKKEKDEKDQRKKERGWLDFLMGILGPQFQNPAQFPMGSIPNINPAGSNFDPSSWFTQPNIQAANASFDPGQFLQQMMQANAAQVNFDPSQALGAAPTVNAATFNFRPRFNEEYLKNWQAINPQFGALGQEFQEMGKSPLPNLDPTTAASLQQLLDAAMGNINMGYETDKEALINDLYGRGMNRSTAAVDQAGKLLYGRDQLKNQAYSDAAQREIALRQNMRDFALQTLASRMGLLGEESQTLGAQAGLGQQGDIARNQMILQALMANSQNQQQANLANAGYQAQYGLAGADMGMRTALANAGFQQEAGMQNAQMFNQLLGQGMEGQLRTQLANAGFSQEAAMQMAQLLAQQQIAGMQGGLQQSLANAGFEQQANMSNAEMVLRGLLTNYQGGLQQQGLTAQTMAQLMNDLTQRLGINVNKNIQYAQMDNEMKMLMYQLEQRRWEMANQPKPGLFGKIMGAVAPFAGLALAPFTGGLSAVALAGLGGSAGAAGLNEGIN